MVTVPNLNSVGYFHFQEDFESPIPALDQAIEDFKKRGGVLPGALIVLPEAFNIRKPYFDMKAPDVNPAIRDTLATRSRIHGCAFVAGLIVDDAPGISPCYSS